MKKSIVAILITTLAFTSTASANNNSSTELLSSAKISTDRIGIEFGLGGVFTNLEGYDGEGFKVSARINMPRLIPENKHQIELYGKISYQTSYDDNNTNNSYFNETELVIGLEGDIVEEHKIFIELGDIKQNFEVDNNKIWQDYGSVYRIGSDTQYEYGTFNIAIEHRDGRESATGYRTVLTSASGRTSLSYTNVGDYEVIAFNFNFSF